MENKMENHIWDDDTDWEFCIIFMVLKPSSVIMYRVAVTENPGLEETIINNEPVEKEEEK